MQGRKMIRYNEIKLFNLEEADNGAYVAYTDVINMMSSTYDFVLAHADDIEKGVGEFGRLKPLLELVRGIGNS